MAIAVAIAGLIAITLTTPLFSIASSFMSVAVVVVIWSLAQNATFPAAQVEMGRLHPANPATAFALFAALVQLGGAIGAAVSAGVLEVLGPQWIPVFAAVASALAAVVMAALAHRLRRQRRGDTAPARVGSRGSPKLIRIDSTGGRFCVIVTRRREAVPCREPSTKRLNHDGPTWPTARPSASPPRTSIGPTQMTGPLVTVIETPERSHWLKWIDRFNTLLAVVGGVATVGLMLNIVADVIGRYFFNRPLPGTLDLTQFAWMPMLVSLGLGYALLRGEHIRVNLLTAPTGPRTQRIIEIVGMVFTLGTVAMLIWFGTEKAVDAMGFSEKAVGTPWLAIWPFRWVITVGLVGLLLQAFAQLLRAITVPEFRPADEDEVVAAIEVEETVFDELQIPDPTTEPDPGDADTTPGTTEKVKTR